MQGVRIGKVLRQSRAVVLIELAVLAVAVVGAAVLFLLPDDRSEPAATASPSQSTESPGLPDSTAPVLMPGRPGEAARTAPANEVSALPRDPHNNADVRFMTMMIPHHEQALVMARLVAERAENEKLERMAERMLAAQEPEIKYMETWLAERGLNRNSGGDHRHTMSGMQTAEALNRLTAARGAEFDRMFVTMMTEHHEGAIKMAEEVLVLGSDRLVNELASSVIVEQNVEINRMREALAGS
ncbi:DUF305 domain-containing protein [Micromonospora sp. NPDC048871]|uniref:DUF305 domain-containing protein n=1 Tax=unclassified Micromonospora TaxID=2617518 RepID=UPI002E110936|nr:DUF305 domain-containing protein [Micromonospora sp. NBC_01739]